MGKRLYVATKYEVKYDSTCAFNWTFDDFKDLLRELNVYICSEDEEGFSDVWECLKSEFKNALQALKDNKDAIISGADTIDVAVVDPSEGEDKFVGADVGLIRSYLFECTNMEKIEEALQFVILIMEDYIEQCEKKGDYMHFCQF